MNVLVSAPSSRLEKSALVRTEPHPARLVWLCLALLVAAGFLIRLWGLTHMHFWDENVYLLNADYILTGKAGYLEIDSRPPLISVFFAGVFALWHSDYAAQIVTSLLNALGPLFLYLAGRRIVSRAAASIAAILLAFGPFFAGACADGDGGFVENCNGHSLLTDCPALTLILLSLWLLVRALESQTASQTNLRFFLAGLALASTVLMRFGSLSTVGVLMLLPLAARFRWRALAVCLAGFLAGMAPYLCWSRLRYGGFLETLRNGWANLGGLPEPFLYYVQNMPQMLTWLSIAGLALWLLGCAFLLARILRGNRPHFTGLAERISPRWQAFLLFWALAVLLFFSSIPHKESRYSIPVAPPLLLLAASGLALLLRPRQKSLRIAAAVVLASGLLIVCWPTHHRFDTGFIDPSVSEEMNVSAWLRGNLPATTILYTNQNYPDFAWYSGMNAEALPEDEDGLAEEIDKLPADGILIAYRVNGNDPAQPPAPSPAKLDQDPHFKRLREFPSLILYTYRAF